MNKEIKEMTRVICGYQIFPKGDTAICEYSGLPCDYECDERDYAEALYNAGYRKIVWHKVADGDLPVVGQTVIAYAGLDTFVAYINYKLDSVNRSWIKEWYCATSNTPACNIIAWTELPKYEEK